MFFFVEKIKIPKSAYHSRVDLFARQKRLQCKAKYPMIDTFPHGAPLGGFGAGTFARTVYGDFAVWHLFPGVHIYEPIKSCNLAIYQKDRKKRHAYVLNHNKEAVMSSWQALPHKRLSTYAAQYPKSWYVYDKLPAKVTVEQFATVLPHNYKETSYPAACFRVQFENKQKHNVEVSVLLSWENMLGWSYEAAAANSGVTKFRFQRDKVRRYNRRIEEYEYKGIVLSGEVSTRKTDVLAGEFCIAAKEVEGTKIFFCSSFDGEGDGREVWESFAVNGTLKDSVRPNLAAKGAAIAVKATVSPGQTIQVPLVITWDLPKTNQGKTFRYYTNYFDRNGHNSFSLAKEVLKKFDDLGQEISRWHNSLDKNIPDWLVGNMFNELYYLADGGTIWDAATKRFTYLECFDFYFYETLDVRYYGAFSLAKFWPEIEKTIMKDFVRTIYEEDRSQVEFHASMTLENEDSLAGQQKKQYIHTSLRKRKYAVPHDIGSPFEDVWQSINAYTWQNSNLWKDLGSKFILMIYRAYYYSGKKDRDFLKESWEAITKVLEYTDQNLDKDGDYLPENESFPDQTFDNWLMKGTSAYCGILRLAALQTAIQIADILEQKEEARQLRVMFKKAKDSLDHKLWNGNYYNFDQKSDDIMAAQLMGQWYLDQLHLPAVIAEDKIRKIFETIYKYNFQKFYKGSKGVVNGSTVKAQDVSCEQGNDVWPGVNYALAAHMLLYGEKKKAFKILKAVTKQIYNKGMLFRTPESWDGDDKFIASMYMRPGAIWAIADCF